MTKTQLISLSICSLVPWTVGNGLLPLLPVYAVQFGATPAGVGYYLAFAYLALTLGTMFAGWLSDRLQRRKALLVAAGVLMIPVVWLMGLATTILQLAVLSASVWFLGGVQIALVNILVGLLAEKERRGTAFGFLGLTPPLGLFIGGLTSGPLADGQGFQTMFAVFAVFSAVLPLVAVFSADESVQSKDPSEISPTKVQANLAPVVFLLAIGVIVGQSAAFIGNMGRSIAMNELGFLSADISSTSAIGGAVMLPFPLLLGWLSDRVGRKHIMSLCYFATSMALVVLALSESLWHFWTFAILLSIGSITSSVGAAYVTDAVPPDSIDLAMSLFRAGGWFGGVIGFACGGYLMQSLGMTSTFIVGAFLPMIAIAMLIPIKESIQQ